MPFITEARTSSESVVGYINITAKKGGLFVGETPLLIHLKSEDLIDKATFDALKGKPFKVQFESRYLAYGEYEWQGKTQRSVELRGTTEVGDKTYGVSFKAGFESVAAGYLLGGLLMVGNPFDRTLLVSASGQQTKSGYIVTQVWVNLPEGEVPDGLPFNEIKNLDNSQRLNKLADLYPGKVFGLDEPSEKPVLDDLPF